jgi:putative RNA 2'-phosphotransferase
MHPADVRRSKRLALVLRHRPGSVGLALDEHGWVPVPALLDALARHGSSMTREDLARVVDENDKQRFEWDREADRIRARQGHSLHVDLGLAPETPPSVLFHGTPRRTLDPILADGLEPRGRQHVHLSPDVETARRVGARRGEAVVLVVDAAALAATGATFWRSTNGVWLTDHVPPEFLSVL